MLVTELKSRLEKSLDHLKIELSQIRTGRANPSLVEDIRVEAYGSKMSIKEVGSITVLDSQNLVIVPWDKSLIPVIAKTIQESDLKLSPIDDGDKIRLPLPPLTEERRKELIRVVSSKVEDTKNSMRNIRQEAMKDIEKDFADKKIGEDDKFRNKEETEKIVKEFIQKSEEFGNSKEEDLMKV